MNLGYTSLMNRLLSGITTYIYICVSNVLLPTNIITEKRLDGVYNRHVENIPNPLLVSKRENEFFLEG